MKEIKSRMRESGREEKEWRDKEVNGREKEKMGRGWEKGNHTLAVTVNAY